MLGGVAAAAAVVGGIFGVRSLHSRDGADRLFAARFPDLAGNPRQLREWQGQALLCNFWATWCAPCREEIPLLAAAQQQNKKTGLQVVGIAVDSVTNVRQFAASSRIPYPVLIAGAGAIELMEVLGNPSGALPFTVLVNRGGRLAGSRLGAYSAAQLEAAVGSLLQ